MKVVNALLFVSMFMFEISNSLVLEFDVANHFDMDGVQIKLEATVPGEDTLGRRKVQIPRGEKLHWTKTVRQYSPDMNFICHVYICMGAYETLLDFFVAFDAQWIESSLIDSPEHKHLKFDWIVNQHGASLTPFPELNLHEFEYPWKHVILIFILTNEWSNQKDLIISFQTEEEEEEDVVTVPSQEILPYGQKIARAERIAADERQHFQIKCYFRVVSDAKHGYFKMFDSSWLSETKAIVGIRKYEWVLNEHQATMSNPRNHAEMYN